MSANHTPKNPNSTLHMHNESNQQLKQPKSNNQDLDHKQSGKLNEACQPTEKNDLNDKQQVDSSAKTDFPRFINTFMKRRTHVSKTAEQALNDPAYAKYIVNSTDDKGQGIISNITDLRALFADTELTPNGSEAPLTFEIGFGMGGSLIEMAKADPSRNFVGIEVHEPGIGKCAFMAGEENLSNLKIINGDAIRLMQQLPENHIDRIQLYFPDPWQKKRHYKRRFVSPTRMQIVTRVLKSGGWFHTATDWEHYAFWMLEVLDNFEGLTNTAGKGNFTPRPDFRPMTKFENRGIDRGHGVWDLIYIKD